MTLIFATNNQNKVKEIRAVLGNDFSIITLKEAGIDIDIPEPHHTLEANAKEKSTVIHTLTNKNCFSEDTGLEVEALNGEPGVRSARYAGDETDFKKNIEKLITSAPRDLIKKINFRRSHETRKSKNNNNNRLIALLAFGRVVVIFTAAFMRMQLTVNQ